MTRPAWRVTMSGTTSRVTRKVPVTFTAKALFQMARSVFTNGALGASPALLTRISMEPNALRADAMPARTLASSVTSKSACDLRRRMGQRGLTVASGSRRRPARLTRAPALAQATAIAAPMPVPAPVTRTCRSLSVWSVTTMQRSGGRRAGGGARQVGFVLRLGGQILLRPGDRFHRRSWPPRAGPGGVGEMRTGDRA